MTFARRAVVALGHEGEVVTALGSRYRYKVVGVVVELAAQFGTRVVGPPIGAL